jgi:HD-GYP domain-containing protein (c-di-GMP phosphodiesterase class II)
VRIGYELMSRVAFLASAAEIVLTHQECFDGSGYPQGLAGEQIPLGARIFAVADTLDAIMSDRPYRCGRPYAVARAEIARESGTQFDPQVVAAFLSVPEETWVKIRTAVAGDPRERWHPSTERPSSKRRTARVGGLLERDAQAG